MGSLVTFPELNRLPHPTGAGAAVAGDRIEPKPEPMDEAPEFQPLPPPLAFPSQQQPINDSPNFPQYSRPIVSLNPNLNFDGSNWSRTSNVYSEFNRVSELFNTAFGGQMQEYQGDTEILNPEALAIIPALENSAGAGVPPALKYPKRSSMLVRVTDLGTEDERYYREVVRKTRMIYDSLRIFSTADDEKRLSFGFNRRTRGDLKASAVMRERGLWLQQDKRIVGPIPGIEIGDVFFFRMEMCVVGLHGQPQAGIDYLTSSMSSNGEPIATSIIVSGGYEDDEDSGDVIIYTGHGGQDKKYRQCAHQKLAGGNLGLERSMHYGIEVRVVRGFKYEGSASGKIYVYDGLYKVVESWFDVGKSGFGVYKFKIVRLENQPIMGSAILRFAQNLKARQLVVQPRGYVSLDISMRMENFPVPLFNDIDNDREPLAHQYLVRSTIPQYVYHLGNNSGCDCVSGCSRDCFCAMKNGGEFAYDEKGILIRGKPLIFECGPHCSCPPGCRNRVAQKGVRNRFEVFRSRETGWGVRCLDLIQAGAFLCEYSGVVLTRDQAKVISMVGGDGLVYPSRFTDKWAEWGDLSSIYSDYVRPSYPSVPPLDFAMDVSTMRNVACYISHSKNPNVMVQFVLYDHNNVMFPRLMLFAMENIPPLRELSLDYGVADEWSAKLAICN